MAFTYRVNEELGFLTDFTLSFPSSDWRDRETGSRGRAAMKVQRFETSKQNMLIETNTMIARTRSLTPLWAESSI